MKISNQSGESFLKSDINAVVINIAILLLMFGCASLSFAGLGNDDSWFNGRLGPAPADVKGVPVGGVRYPTYVPSEPPPPTKEELDLKDLKESSDDYVDKGNKWFRQGKWASAIAYYEKALKEDPDNDDARHNLKKAKDNLRAAEEQKLAEQQRLIAEQERLLAEQQRLFVEKRDKVIQDDRAYHNTQLERLMAEADHINVPPPASGHIHEGIILGLFDPQDEAETALINTKSPFSGLAYTKEDIFSSADSKTAHEALRGFLDNQTIGEYTLNTEYGKQLIARLNGKHVDRLIAHSNGGTIAEALIKKGIIKVDELNIMGGDRSLVNQHGYQNLIDSGKVKRVIVWVNPGDVIPVGSSLPYVTPMGGVSVAPLITSAEHYANELTGTHQGGDAIVEYRLLKGNQYEGQTIHTDKTVFGPHELGKSYLPNVRTYFGSHNNN